MKLLILSTVYPRGKTELPGHKVHGKFIHHLARAWVQQGHSVHVLTPHSIQTEAKEVMEGVHIHRFHYFFKREWETLTYGDGIPENIKQFKNKLLVLPFALAFLVQALRLIRQHKIEVVNAHWAVPLGYLGLWLKWLSGVRLITTLYGAELYPVQAGRMKILKPFLRWAIRGADGVAGISQATIKTAQALSGRADIKLIPPGIDTSYYQPGPPAPEILEKYNLPPSAPHIVFSGRMVERKGHRYLLEAMVYLREKYPEAKLVLGGNGILYESLKGRRAELGLENHVELPGYIPEAEMVPFLQTATVYALPSSIDQQGDTEGSALAALEAMACGTPAVVSRIGGNVGAIVEGQGAIHCPPNQPEALAEAISEVLDTLAEEPNFAQQAREHVLQHYDWAVIVRQYKTLSGL